MPLPGVLGSRIAEACENKHGPSSAAAGGTEGLVLFAVAAVVFAVGPAVVALALASSARLVASPSVFSTTTVGAAIIRVVKSRSVMW